MRLALVLDSHEKDSVASSEAGCFDKSDRYVRRELYGSGIPGLALAVVEDGRTVHAPSFGDDGSSQFITPQTPFWIGSNTKSFTALAIMQLVEAGKVDLNAQMQRYVPEFRVADDETSSLCSVDGVATKRDRKATPDRSDPTAAAARALISKQLVRCR